MITRSTNQSSLRKKRIIPKKRQIKTLQRPAQINKNQKNILKKRKIIKKAPKKQGSKYAKQRSNRIAKVTTTVPDKPRISRSSSVRRSKRKISINPNRQFVSIMIASSKLKCQTNRKNKQSKSKSKTNKAQTIKHEKVRSSSRIRRVSESQINAKKSNYFRSSNKKKEGKNSISRNSRNQSSVQKSKKKEIIPVPKPRMILRQDIKLEEIDQNMTTSQMQDQSAERYKIVINKPKAAKEDKGKSILALQAQKKIQSSRSFILSVEERDKQLQIKVSQLKKKGQIITIRPQGVTCSCINYRIHHSCENIDFLFDKVIRNPELKEQILYRKFLGQKVFEQVSQQVKKVLGFLFSEKKSLKEHPLPNCCLICFEQLSLQPSLSCEQCDNKFHKGCYEYFKFNCNRCPTCKKQSIKLQNQQPLRQMEKLVI